MDVRPNLPAVQEDAEVEEAVFEGEVVDDEPQKPPVVVLRPVVQVFQTINVVVTAPQTKAVARHAAYVPQGALALMRRRHQGRTIAQRMAVDLHQQGKSDQALLLLTHEADSRQSAHERWKGRVDMLVTLASHWKPIGGVTAALMLGIGIANHSPFLAFETAAALARDAWTAAVWSWRIGVYAVPIGVLAWLYRAGRRESALPGGWSLTALPEGEGRGLVVTADAIVVALQHLSIPKLDKAFKDGWQPSFHTLPVRDGEGYFCVFSLPMGVTTAMIADKNEVFARNLHRAKTEVWPTDAEREKIAPAGYVALWVANPGVLDRPAPEYPLMHDGQADVFQGVPGGVVARGDGALLPVVANNLVLGGQMGNGKSNGCRVYMLGCATDPLCELHVFVFANNGDFDEFAPRLATYVKGTEDDTAAAAVSHLHDLLDEVGRREGRLAELGAKKLTRRIAEQHPDMRPSVSLFSECHDLFGHPEYGELAAELAVKVIKRARKTGIVLAFDTQSSRKGAIPPALVELVSVNGCFYVKTWRSNDGFLGDGAFQAGIRATELRPGRDVGRSVTTGISDAQFELLKWYYVEVDDDTGWDAATEVIARCMKNLAPGTRVSGGDGASLPVIVVRDLLDDVNAVIDGPWRVSVNELPHRLKQLDQTWPEYRKLTGAQLRKRLTDLGVKTTNTDNRPELDPADLRRAIDAREVSELP